MHDDDAATLGAVGEALRRARTSRGLSQEEVARATGISPSTLSRLERGGRRPTLELLLPLARSFGTGLEELVDAPATGDPRTQLRVVRRGGRSFVDLTRRRGGVRAFKMVVPPGPVAAPSASSELRSHEGHQWLHVLSGRLSITVGRTSAELGPGEVVEFDTRRPHRLENPGEVPCEVLCLYGPQGQRMRVRQLG